ncbi:MAG TPA: hypothetical protein VK798_13255 [Alloacidobacterium sp.]|jgi:hypothetical protein|nr:hypothetical protein [Alloacidobacterium sp.]
MREAMSIWFFAGVLFLIYGVIITAQGLWELAHPPTHPPVLFHLHPAIWWGAMMGIAGLLYTIRFWPRVKR